MTDFSGINLKEYEGRCVNFHCHTPRCGHATGTEREYVEAAIAAGYDVLGFSDHSPLAFKNGEIGRIRMQMNQLEDYVESVLAVKHEYEDDIEIHLGLELEYLPDYFDDTIEQLEQYPIEYLIMGQHFLNSEDREEYVANPTADEKVIETYADRVIAGLETGKFLYLAHPALIRYIGPEEIYFKHMGRIQACLKEHEIPVELNVSGFARGLHYPSFGYVMYCAEHGSSFILGIDSHSPEELARTSDVFNLLQRFRGLIIPGTNMKFGLPYKN